MRNTLHKYNTALHFNARMDALIAQIKAVPLAQGPGLTLSDRPIPVAARVGSRSRGAEQRHELAALHSITSSAIASRDGGTVRPSVLAVLRLITSSNLVG